MPGYTAYFSNSLKKLASVYVSDFYSTKLFGSDSLFIVQNKNMEEWLKLEISRTAGIYCGINFRFQDRAVREIIESFCGSRDSVSGKRIVYLDDLKIIIYRHLEAVFGRIESCPEFMNLKKYIEESPDRNSPDLVQIRSERLFSLSDSIAGLFYHYGINCPEMTLSWENGKSFVAKTTHAYSIQHEKWQMSLWNMIFSPDSGYIHLGQVISDIVTGKYPVPRQLPDIFIFGSSFLSEQSVNFFHYLTEKCGIDVNHFILSPSPSCSREEQVSESDDFTRGAAAAPERWSDIVKGLASCLHERNARVVECYEEPDGKGLLGCLKKAVYYGKTMPEISSASDQADIVGKSVRIVRASGKKREIEILKDSVLRLVSDHGYKFHEIGVAAPDINEYIPGIESVFPSRETMLDVPYNIIDISLAGQSDFIKGFLSLTALCGARFSRKELFSVFSNRCFMEKFSLTQEDVQHWLELCGELSVKWGVDPEHRKDLLSYSDGSGTWQAALDRLAAGMVFDSDGEEVACPFGGAVIPYPVRDRSAGQKAAAMFAVVKSLYSDLYGLKKKIMPLKEWTSRFEQIMDRYLKPGEGQGRDRERTFLKNIFRQINNLGAMAQNHGESEIAGNGEFGLSGGRQGGKAFGGKEKFLSGKESCLSGKAKADSSFAMDFPALSGTPVPFPVFSALLEEYAGQGGFYKGQYLSSGVCFSSLKPLRAIPFRAVFLLGMDVDVFPGREKPLSYDLRNITEKSIDLSRNNTDCFAFLETIISTGEILSISYNGVNPVTGETREPAVTVSDILDILSASGKPVETEEHPLFPYDRSYFTEDTEKTGHKNNISFDHKNLKPAAASVAPGKKAPSFPEFSKAGRRSSDAPGQYSVSLQEFTLFLRAPVSSYAHSRLGLSPRKMELAENDINERLGIGFLDHLSFTREIGDSGDNADFETVFSSFHSRRLLEGKASSCPVSIREYELYRQEMFNAFSKLDGWGYLSASPVKILLGQEGSVPEETKPGIITVPAALIETENASLEIRGKMQGLRLGTESGKMRLHAMIYGKKKIKNMIPHFLNFLLLRKNYGQQLLSYSLYDTDGSRICDFTGESGIDTEKSLAAAGKAFVKNMYSPFVVDIEGITAALEAYKKGGSTKEALEAIKKHYSMRGFSDMRYIESYTRVETDFDDPAFRKLLDDFYYYLSIV